MGLHGAAVDDRDRIRAGGVVVDRKGSGAGGQVFDVAALHRQLAGVGDGIGGIAAGIVVAAIIDPGYGSAGDQLAGTLCAAVPDGQSALVRDESSGVSFRGSSDHLEAVQVENHVLAGRDRDGIIDNIDSLIVDHGDRGLGAVSGYSLNGLGQGLVLHIADLGHEERIDNLVLQGHRDPGIADVVQTIVDLPEAVSADNQRIRDAVAGERTLQRAAADRDIEVQCVTAAGFFDIDRRFVGAAGTVDELAVLDNEMKQSAVLIIHIQELASNCVFKRAAIVGDGIVAAVHPHVIIAVCLLERTILVSLGSVGSESAIEGAALKGQTAVVLEAVVIHVPQVESNVLERRSVGDGSDIARGRVLEHNAVHRALDRDVLGQIRQRVGAGHEDLDLVAGLSRRNRLGHSLKLGVTDLGNVSLRGQLVRARSLGLVPLVILGDRGALDEALLGEDRDLAQAVVVCVGHSDGLVAFQRAAVHGDSGGKDGGVLRHSDGSALGGGPVAVGNVAELSRGGGDGAAVHGQLARAGLNAAVAADARAIIHSDLREAVQRNADAVRCGNRAVDNDVDVVFLVRQVAQHEQGALDGAVNGHVNGVLLRIVGAEHVQAVGAALQRDVRADAQAALAGQIAGAAHLDGGQARFRGLDGALTGDVQAASGQRDVAAAGDVLAVQIQRDALVLAGGSKTAADLAARVHEQTIRQLDVLQQGDRVAVLGSRERGLQAAVAGHSRAGGDRGHRLAQREPLHAVDGLLHHGIFGQIHISRGILGEVAAGDDESVFRARESAGIVTFGDKNLAGSRSVHDQTFMASEVVSTERCSSGTCILHAEGVAIVSLVSVDTVTNDCNHSGGACKADAVPRVGQGAVFDRDIIYPGHLGETVHLISGKISERDIIDATVDRAKAKGHRSIFGIDALKGTVADRNVVSVVVFSGGVNLVRSLRIGQIDEAAIVCSCIMGKVDVLDGQSLSSVDTSVTVDINLTGQRFVSTVDRQVQPGLLVDDSHLGNVIDQRDRHVARRLVGSVQSGLEGLEVCAADSGNTSIFNHSPETVRIGNGIHIALRQNREVICGGILSAANLCYGRLTVITQEHAVVICQFDGATVQRNGVGYARIIVYQNGLRIPVGAVRTNGGIDHIHGVRR